MMRPLLAIAALCVATSAFAGEKAKTAAPASDQQLIDSAMTAAPSKVSSGAKIVGFDDKGAMRTLRDGKNGFTCMPDNPNTPGPDPMCMDAAAMEWANAWSAKTPPAAGKVGFMYMLAGGTDASNTDPWAKAPSAENHWVETGPHVMIVGAAPEFYAQYPKGEDPDTSAPYVMWAGTPYQHLMVPVK